jgi:hypothetical protein
MRRAASSSPGMPDFEYTALKDACRLQASCPGWQHRTLSRFE